MEPLPKQDEFWAASAILNSILPFSGGAGQSEKKPMLANSHRGPAFGASPDSARFRKPQLYQRT